MKLFVKLNQPCKFSYLSVYGNQGNTCDNLSVKEQMALEMIMSRLSSSAIYHLGAFSSIAGLLEITEASYDPKFKGLATLNNHIQVALSYFKEAYLPLLRFSRVFPWVEKLMTGQSASITDARKDIFDVNKLLVNLINVAIMAGSSNRAHDVGELINLILCDQIGSTQTRIACAALASQLAQDFEIGSGLGGLKFDEQRATIHDLDGNGTADALGLPSARGRVTGRMTNGVVSGALGPFPNSSWYGTK